LDIRKEVGKRLSHEAQRVGLDKHQLAEHAGISANVVFDYLEGNSELILERVADICKALGVNPYWLMSKHYQPSKTHFRRMQTRSRQAAREIEQAFYLVSEFLPSPAPLRLPEIDSTLQDKNTISALVSRAADKARAIGGTPENICKKINLPVISLRAEADFDAFLLRSGNKCAICVNKDTPPNRIVFSLLHELAHFAYHEGLETAASPQSSLFNPKLKEGEEHEFIADKFAQHFLVPYDFAEKCAVQWPRLDVDQMQKMLDQNRASLDVLTFSVWEALDVRRKKLWLKEVRQVLDDRGLQHGRADNVYAFLIHEQEKLKAVLHERQDMFSDKVLAEIFRGFGLADQC
jgi:Zn-dependent peptidase ImmA (M78 family)